MTSERGVLCLKSALRPEQRGDSVSKKQSSAIIAVDVRRFGHAINTDEVFGKNRTKSTAIAIINRNHVLIRLPPGGWTFRKRQHHGPSNTDGFLHYCPSSAVMPPRRPDNPRPETDIVLELVAKGEIELGMVVLRFMCLDLGG